MILLEILGAFVVIGLITVGTMYTIRKIDEWHAAKQRLDELKREKTSD